MRYAASQSTIKRNHVISEKKKHPRHAVSRGTRGIVSELKTWNEEFEKLFAMKVVMPLRGSFCTCLEDGDQAQAPYHCKSNCL